MNIQEKFVVDLTNPKFQISNYGRALYLPTSSFINPVLIKPNAYTPMMCWAIVNEAEYICIPRSVALNFLKDDPNYGELIIHLDLNSMNNRVDNLRWVRRTDLISNSNDISTVHNICLLLEKGYSSSQIINTLNVDRPRRSLIELISGIKRGILYQAISAQYNFPKEYSNKRYTEEEKHKICELIKQGFNAQEIAELMNIPCNDSFRSILSGVKHKKYWASISNLYF